MLAQARGRRRWTWGRRVNSISMSCVGAYVCIIKRVVRGDYGRAALHRRLCSFFIMTLIESYTHICALAAS